MTILAIDPGSTKSAWLIYNTGNRAIRSFDIAPNEALIASIRRGLSADVTAIVIEKIESYGMPVGAEVFDTVYWSGRFTEAAYPMPVHSLPRRTIKLAICGDSRAKDANIRQALLDRFGGKATAVGTKRAPGPLYGIAKDVWSALAIAVTFAGIEP